MRRNNVFIARCKRIPSEIQTTLETLHRRCRHEKRRFETQFAFDTSAEAARAHLRAKLPHDPDYGVFEYFSSGESILDVGANSGYSSTSIWAAGSAATVLSLEALHIHRAALETIRSANEHRFDFCISAVADRDRDLEFILPMIDGLGLSSLATAAEDVHWPSMSENLLRFGPRHDGSPECVVGLQFVPGRARPLDDLLTDTFRSHAHLPLAAIKIDVEGLEAAVIAGASRTLRRHRPLLLIEGARWRPELVEALAAAGYLAARRVESQLVLAEGAGEEVNTFFVHASKARNYRRRGLLQRLSLSDHGRVLKTRIHQHVAL
ncbi:MAG: FkbM family methyltransferase [Hyphomicrobiales bacterium]